MIVDAGGNNLVENLNSTMGSTEVDREWVISDDALKETIAASNARISLICGDLNTGPMQAAGTAFMAKILHPELFEDLDPDEILKEYLETWQRIPYKGIWIYPPLNEERS